jgi:glycolate oxidase FAD binding subunit
VPAAPLDAIRRIVGADHVRGGIALSSFVVEGRTPEAAVFPGSVEEVRAVVEAAGKAGTPLIAWGGGTAAAIGTPVERPGIVLSLARLGALIEHEPGDLTATVQAGMTMAALQTALRARGQWLALDPPDRDRATVGGVLAANAAGPRRHLYGTARDLLIGVTAVTGEGAIVRGGGKVVKNVAGYDLPKLFIGSHGTLGVIVEATVKLRPLPDEERLVAVRFERIKDAGAAVRAVMASDLIPSAIELLDVEASRALALSDPPPGATLVLGFDGMPEQVEWQCAQVPSVVGPCGGTDPRPLDATAWDRLGVAAAAAFETPAAVVRFAVLPALVAEAMEQGAAAARQRGLPSAWSAHAGVGVMYAAIFAQPGPAQLKSLVAALGEWRNIARAGGGHAVLERAPLAVKDAVPVWDDVGAAGRIMQRIKSRLDPGNILNPGRFVAGI